MRMRTEERLLSHIKVTPAGCFEWQGSKNSTGYGQVHYLGRLRLAHIVSFEVFRGPLNGLWALHRCDNRPCINPAHLFSGTRSDNMRDAYRKGRCKNTFERAICLEDIAKIKAFGLLGVRAYDLVNWFPYYYETIHALLSDESLNEVEPAILSHAEKQMAEGSASFKRKNSGSMWHQPWTSDDDKIVLDTSKTCREIGIILKRSCLSVKQRRCRLRKSMTGISV